MGDHGFESPLPLTQTILTQKEISRNLVVRPLSEILGEKAYHYIHDAVPISARDTGQEAYFNPIVPSRKYYNDEKTVWAREDMSNDLEVVVEFEPEKSLEVIVNKTTRQKRGIKYLPLKHLCLVKKDGSEEAIDLVHAWQAKEAKLGRPIGLLQQEEQEDAVMGQNAILFRDEAVNKKWHMLKTKGSLTTGTELPPNFAQILAGAKATQKFEDLPKGVAGIILDSFTGVMGKSFSHLFRQSLFHPMLSGGKNRAEAAIVRLERNALASSLYFIMQIRSLGFPILPEFSNDDLVNLTHAVLKGQEEQFGIDFS